MDPMPPPPPPPPGMPPPPPPYPQPPVEPLRKTWFQQNKTWAIPVGCLLMVVVLGCCGVLTAGGMLFEKGSSFIKEEKQRTDQLKDEAARIVVEHPVTREAVGEPATADISIEGYSNNNGRIRVVFAVNASGPKGQASGRGEGRRASSQAPWDIGPIVLEVNGEPVKLVEGTFTGTTDQSGEEPWSP